MSYATLQMLSDRFGVRLLIQLTDRGDVSSGVLDNAVLDRALADTDAEIDGRLKDRYVLPLAETPPLIADLAQAIAIYKLHIYAPDPKIEADYKYAMRTLREIADGIVRLSVAGVEVTGTGGSGARVTDRERPLTPETMKGFI